MKTFTEVAVAALLLPATLVIAVVLAVLVAGSGGCNQEYHELAHEQ